MLQEGDYIVMVSVIHISGTLNIEIHKYTYFFKYFPFAEKPITNESTHMWPSMRKAQAQAQDNFLVMTAVLCKG